MALNLILAIICLAIALFYILLGCFGKDNEQTKDQDIRTSQMYSLTALILIK